MKTTLYELSGQLERLAWMLEESAGEITEEMDALLTDTQLAVAEKVANYISLIKNFEAIAAAKKAEKTRLGNSQKADENIVAKLRARLLWFMDRQEIPSLRTRLGTVTLSDNPPKTKPELLIPVEEVPVDYLKEKTVVEVDYEQIAADLEAGIILEWARIPERGKHITIR